MVKRVILAVFVLLLAGCGGGGGGSTSPTSGGPQASDTAAVTAATGPSPTGADSANGTTPTGATGGAGQQADAPCTAEAMAGAVQAALSAGPEGTVAIAECRNGFARVFYRPEATNLETEQLFLVDTDGAWTVLTYGTGIDCADDDLRPAGLEEACVALGLRPASPGGGGALTIDELNAEVTSQAASSPLATSTAFTCISDHGTSVDGTVDTGSVLTCRPDPEPTEGQFPLLTVLVLDAGAGTIAWAQAGVENPSLNADGFFSRSLPRGLNCTDLVADPVFVADMAERLDPDLVYFAVVLYWFLEDRPTPRMDVDSDGIPCETRFPADVVNRVWKGGFVS